MICGMEGNKVSFGCTTVTVSRIGGGIATTTERIGGMVASITKKCGMSVTVSLICATDQGTRYLRVMPENPQTFHWISYTNEIVYEIQSNTKWNIN
jgi:hypothetical protein